MPLLKNAKYPTAAAAWHLWPVDQELHWNLADTRVSEHTKPDPVIPPPLRVDNRLVRAILALVPVN